MAIELRALHYRYPGGTEALRGIDLHIAAGLQVALIGSNGSGKTTLARHLNGLLRPTAGQVLIGGQDSGPQPTATLARQVGYLFQNPDQQLCRASVYDELAFGPRLLGYSAERIAHLVDWALTWMELEPVQALNPFDLPLYLRRRVALASTLAMDTPILVLDEPCAGQDAAFRRRFAALLTELSARGRTVLCICHDLAWASGQFEHCLLLEQGRISHFGRFVDLLQQPERLAPLPLPPINALARRLGLCSGICGSDELLDQLQGIAKGNV